MPQSSLSTAPKGYMVDVRDHIGQIRSRFWYSAPLKPEADRFAAHMNSEARFTATVIAV